MAYLGRGLDKISNIEVLDNITFDGSSSYSITKGSVAFTPNSAQSCLISIDGVVQATNFTVSSSTIDFGVAIPSTSVCNFFLHYGTGVMTVPSDGSVTTAKLGDSAVTTAKINDDAVTSAKLSAGKVLQVVHGLTITTVSSSSLTEVSSGITAQITPSSTSNKILVFGSINGGKSGAVQTGGRIRLRSHDTSTSATSGSTLQTVSNYAGYDNASSDTQFALSFNHLDSPSTTNAINYTITFRRSIGTGAIELQNNAGSSSITLMEIKV